MAAPEPIAAAPVVQAEQRPTASRTRSASLTRSGAPARTVVPVARAASAEPVAAEPVEAPAPVVPMTETPVAAEPVTMPVEPAVAESGDDVLPIVGGAAGLLVLAGGVFALSRRRRDADDEAAPEETWEQERVAYAEPVVEAEPAPIAAPAFAAAALPADFSTYGRHVQAAYRGPTADNPSLSLKRRLKRAAFFDQRERMALEAGATPTPVAAQAEVQAPRRDATITSRRVSPKSSTQALFGGFRPAFQN